ncbi:MAG: ATP-dependent DNA ligase [Candidatus Diapherotrites archaeon]
MQFRKVAEYFEKIEKVSSRLEMTDLVSELLSKASKSDIANVIYLSQGKLGPDFLSLEPGLGEKLVIEAITKFSGYEKIEIEKKFKKQGDLGLVAFELAEKKKQQSLFSEELSVEKVFRNFEKIANAEGAGSQESKIRLLSELLNSGSALEAKFLVRVPLGTLRLGIGDPTLMDALALNYIDEFKTGNKKVVSEIEKEVKIKKEKERAEEISRKIKMKIREGIEAKYNVMPDLGEIAENLKANGLAGLKKIKIKIGVPIRPTLAERLPSADEILKKIGKCAVEHKYDGFRFQVHKKNNEVTIFSRKQENMTHMFPEIVEGVRKQISAKEAIIEGEALAFDEEKKRYYPFQVTIQRKRKYDIDQKAVELPLELFVFDVMYVDGKETMSKKFSERRKILEKLIKKGPVIKPTESIISESVGEIETFFENAIAKGLEGIIAKDLNAPYIAGARKYAWIKLKKSYSDKMTDSVDVVIIGYDKGKGQRTKFGLGNLLTASYDEESDMFNSVARIGTGITEERLKELEEMLSKTKVSSKPARVNSEIKPDVWVEPKYVIEVIADEVTQSPLHMCAFDKKEKTGLALRFPRMVSFRVDKSPEEATTDFEIMKMYKQQTK